MSECITRVERITKVEAHLNADRLEIAHVKGWHCVVAKGDYKAGDLCVYIPIDSILPQQLVDLIFVDTKVSLPKNRIKTIRLRGMYSQGLVVLPSTINEYLGNHGKHIKLVEGVEITEALGITKFEPHVPQFQTFGIKKSTPKNPNPLFKKYAGFENFKNYNDLFAPEEQVIATEKIHGTNFRAGWVKREVPTKWYALLWFKFMSLIKKDYEWEWLVGSHNVQLNPNNNNLYCNMARTLGLKDKLHKGEEVFGEIFGPTVQRGYHYGKLEGAFGFVAFDLIENGEWTDYEHQVIRFKEMNIDTPPVLFRGKFKELNIEQMVLGNSIYCPAQKVREGIVLRTVHEEFNGRVKGGRKMLKCISPEYLLRDNTDFH